MKPGVDLYAGGECRHNGALARSCLAHDGDQEAAHSSLDLKAVVEQLGPTARLVAAALVGDRKTGDDIAVGAFAALHRAQIGRDLDTIQARVLREVYHRARSFDRTRRARRDVSRLLSKSTSMDQSETSKEVIWVALLGLQFRLRAAIVLREIAQLSFERIGVITDRDPRVVKVDITTARSALVSELARRRQSAH